MSEATSTSPAPSEPAAEAKPFNPDVLLTCTSRFTRSSWDLLLSYVRTDVEQMRTVPLKATLTARTGEGAKEIQQILMKESGVTEIQAHGTTIKAIATFAALQSVIKNPQTAMLEVIPAEGH
jgi:hypothetical protein